MNRKTSFLILLTATLLVPAHLCAAHHARSQAEGIAMLERFKAKSKTLADWNKLSAHVRKYVLIGAKLEKFPAKTPLNPIVHSKREFDGYTVSNVALETLPGFFSTGNLYVPTKAAKPFPIVLCPHGHFRDEEGNLNGRSRASMQVRCAILAKMGAVVFAIDQVGAGDSKQSKHHDPLSMPLQIWNNIRTLDYLSTLPNVDTSRIGVTGASGGGSQTMQMGAIDPRVTVVCPVVMMAANYDGGCVCESGLPIFRSEHHEANLAMLGAMAAPRPQLVISCGDDWTVHTPKNEYPYLQSVYTLFNAKDKVDNLHLANEEHSYGPSKRKGMYPFFAKHLGLSMAPITDKNNPERITEPGIIIQTPAQLAVFNEEHPRPKHAAMGQAAVYALFDKATGRDKKENAAK